MNLSVPKNLCVPVIAAASHGASLVFAADQLKSVKAPSGWQIALFAAPADVGYPTCLSTSPSGDLYVGIDENGSLDAKPGRGRVVRCTDRDGDGKADTFVTFATMDSPRGIWFDNNVLYVMRPPVLEAFIDDDGDGKSDRSEVLVRGLGFDLKFRGADHTVNGMRMGIDGFFYIACGDYGATNAVGKDGTRIQLHGGGVVRVRTDGTGLEIVSRGQRNIFDVAVSPELDLFTRDNTNDGDGWDVRLSHVVMGGNYGSRLSSKSSARKSFNRWRPTVAVLPAARCSELCESILKPNAKIAQGFETQWFKTKDDEELEGFVTREGGDDLDVRNVAGITTTLARKNIAERGRRKTSVMPGGLVDKLTAGELASLLAFLESTKSQ